MGGYSLQNLLQSSPAPMSSIFPTAYCSSSTSSSVPTNRFNFGAGVGPATAALKASATGVWSLVNRATGPSGSPGRSTRVPSSVSIGNIRDPYSANIGSVPGPHSTSISGVPGPHSTYHSMQTRSSTKSSSPHVIIVPSCASSSGSLTSHLPKSTSSGVGYIGNSIVTSTSGIAHSSTSGSSGSISLKKKPSKTSKSSNSPPLGRVDWKAKGTAVILVVDKTVK